MMNYSVWRNSDLEYSAGTLPLPESSGWKRRWQPHRGTSLSNSAETIKRSQKIRAVQDHYGEAIKYTYRYINRVIREPQVEVSGNPSQTDVKGMRSMRPLKEATGSVARTDAWTQLKCLFDMTKMVPVGTVQGRMCTINFRKKRKNGKLVLLDC